MTTSRGAKAVPSKRLSAARVKIDDIDDRILQLLKERQSAVEEIAGIKAKEGLDAFQPKRYIEMMKRIHKKAESLGLDTAMVRIIWNTLHQASTERQQYMTGAASRGKAWLYRALKNDKSR